jgi:hypothetical protein
MPVLQDFAKSVGTVERSAPAWQPKLSAMSSLTHGSWSDVYAAARLAETAQVPRRSSSLLSMKPDPGEPHSPQPAATHDLHHTFPEQVAVAGSD